MPNPQVHAAIGMIGFLIIAGIVYLFVNKEYKKKILIFLPLIILIGAVFSMIPDIPEIANDFPTIFGKVGLDRKDKPAWNTPAFNICFAHPYLDSKYPEQYDTTGLIITLIVFNSITGIYIAKTFKNLF